MTKNYWQFFDLLADLYSQLSIRQQMTSWSYPGVSGVSDDQASIRPLCCQVCQVCHQDSRFLHGQVLPNPPRATTIKWQDFWFTCWSLQSAACQTVNDLVISPWGIWYICQVGIHWTIYCVVRSAIQTGAAHINKTHPFSGKLCRTA